MTAPAADRIDYNTLTALVEARAGQGMRRALYRALEGINAAERTMREKIDDLRSALVTAETRLDAGFLRIDTGQVQRAAADLDRAAVARDLHWAAARDLLTQDELRELTTPPAA
jgi:hypothetical protein